MKFIFLVVFLVFCSAVPGLAESSLYDSEDQDNDMDELSTKMDRFTSDTSDNFEGDDRFDVSEKGNRRKPSHTIRRNKAASRIRFLKLRSKLLGRKRTGRRRHHQKSGRNRTGRRRHNRRSRRYRTGRRRHHQKTGHKRTGRRRHHRRSRRNRTGRRRHNRKSRRNRTGRRRHHRRSRRYRTGRRRFRQVLRRLRRTFSKLKKRTSWSLFRKLLQLRKSLVIQKRKSYNALFSGMSRSVQKSKLNQLITNLHNLICKKKCMKKICDACGAPVYTSIDETAAAPSVKTSPTTQLDHKEGVELLKEIGISFVSNGHCSNAAQSKCVSLNGGRVGTFKGLMGLKVMCNASQIDVVGGTEVDLNQGRVGDGWKMNLKATNSLTACIVANFKHTDKGCTRKTDCFIDLADNKYHYVKVGTTRVWELRTHH